MNVVLLVIAIAACLFAAAAMLLVIHGARQAEIHQQIENDHRQAVRARLLVDLQELGYPESSNIQEDNHA